jgi:hypothetical protein
MNRFCVCLLAALFAIAPWTGCKKKDPASLPAQPATRSAYFQTPFQTETEFIVTAIASDLAEQISFAGSRQVPGQKGFAINAIEKPGADVDRPTLKISGRIGPRNAGIDTEVTVTGPVWSPEVYEKMAGEFARAVNFKADDAPAEVPAQGDLLGKLANGEAETIEEQSQEVSAALQKNFASPELHERAALILAAFLLRDHSGKFFEIRSPLSRMTTHLTMARWLRGKAGFGIQGQIAEAALLALINDGAAARDRLDAIKTNDASAAAFIRALRAHATWDFRPLAAAANKTHLEAVECFRAMAHSVSPTVAWGKLDEQEKRNIDFVRTASQFSHSVQVGHELLALLLPLEMREAQSVHALWHGGEPEKMDWAKDFNDAPEGCFTSKSGGAPAVRIIGWGQWANFLQRHLCHAVQHDFMFMNVMWGVPDDAKEFAAACEQRFGGLWMYAFVRRFNCTDVKSYHRSVDEGMALTKSTPHLVSAECWNYLCYKPNFAELYLPNSNPHVNEWHNHNPPPGTVYDLNPRLNHPSLTGRSGSVARFERLYELSPYDVHISNWLVEGKFKKQPTYQQALDLYRPVMDYDASALRQIASRIADQPQPYEKLLLQAAEMDPATYYVLAAHADKLKQWDKAANYYDQACDKDDDAVRVASYANWRIQYYLGKAKTEKAREIADFAGEVYSYAGLNAKAHFFEATTNYDDAFQWFAKIEERYGKSGPLLNFCIQYKNAFRTNKYDAEVEKRVGKLFPRGEEKAALADFKTPPQEGVLIFAENDLLKASGLKKGDVIVALDGRKVYDLDQYLYVRDLKATPELDLIVWQGTAYREVKASPPQRRFGLDFRDYIRGRTDVAKQAKETSQSPEAETKR